MLFSPPGPVEPPNAPKEAVPSLDHPQVPLDATPVLPQPPVSSMSEDLDYSQACAMLDAPDKTMAWEFQVRLEENFKFDFDPVPNNVPQVDTNPVVPVQVPIHVEPTDDSVSESTSPESEDKIPLLTVGDPSYCNDKRFAPVYPAIAHMSKQEREDYHWNPRLQKQEKEKAACKAKWAK